jgi:3-deoxy-D-manno-octulosonic-acid transferase
VIVGPHMENFQEIADELTADGALLRAGSAEALGDAVAALIADPARAEDTGRRARAVVDRNRGAVQRTVDALAALMP